MSSAKAGVLAPGEESSKFSKILWSLDVKKVKTKVSLRYYGKRLPEKKIKMGRLKCSLFLEAGTYFVELPL